MPELTEEQQEVLNRCLDDVLERGGNKIAAFIVSTDVGMELLTYDGRGLLKDLIKTDTDFKIYKSVNSTSNAMNHLCTINDV